MTVRQFGMAVALVAAILPIAISAPQAQGAKQYYLGAGYNTQTVSGGLDGSKVYADATDSVAFLAGKPGSGSGTGLIGGLRFTPTVSAELVFAQTSHTATHKLVTFDSNMSLQTIQFNVKGSKPIDKVENLEVFGKIGFATATASFDSYALKGTNVTATASYDSKAKVDFSGGGFVVGGGTEYFIDKVALGASYTMMMISFDSARGGGISGTLKNSLSSTITQLMLYATYYFQ